MFGIALPRPEEQLSKDEYENVFRCD